MLIMYNVNNVKAHNVFTEEVNQIALSFNDDKRLKSFDKVKANL